MAARILIFLIPFLLVYLGIEIWLIPPVRIGLLVIISLSIIWVLILVYRFVFLKYRPLNYILKFVITTLYLLVGAIGFASYFGSDYVYVCHEFREEKVYYVMKGYVIPFEYRVYGQRGWLMERVGVCIVRNHSERMEFKCHSCIDTVLKSQ